MKKARKVCYVSRKSGLKSQADRSVRQADSAGRLDSYVSSNKAMGIGFQRKGVKPQPPPFLWSPLWFLSGDAERNVKKEIEFAQDIRLN